MSEPKSQFDKFWSRIKDNPAVAAIMVLGTVVIALASFTDAARSLIDLVSKESRPLINGEWTAEVTYPWRDEKVVETFRFEGVDDIIEGSASFLGTEQVILEGKIANDRIEFITKSTEYAPDWSDNTTKLATHQYRGRIDGDEMELVVETYGGFSADPPVEFIAGRVGQQ